MIRFIVAVTVLFTSVSALGCPEKYRRLSKDHTFCKPINSKCNFVARGLLGGQAEVEKILKIHNDYRSRVAMGKETKAGGLPSGSNMIELTWDSELAEVAQRHAEQCEFKHDCNDCRATRSFSAGQNLAYVQYYCKGNCGVNKANWTKGISMWYDEVDKYNKNQVSSFQFIPPIAHLTQVIWANTYKVGCGYVAYRVDSDWVRMYYVCNYGPAGNYRNAPVYKIGSPCSGCPENSCCGSTCHGQTSYPGLCHLTSNPPIYKPEKKLLFRCVFQDGDPNCLIYADAGGEKWEYIITSGGTLLGTVVREKNYARVWFRKSFKSKRNSCMILTFRNGPNKAGDMNKSDMVVELENNGIKHSAKVYKYPWVDFVKIPVQIFYGGDMKFSIKISVPAGAPPQYLHIQQIDVTEDPCKY